MIMEAKEIPKKELTSIELDRIALKVCAECGIKDTGLPSEEVIDLCLKSWNEKFSARMNRHELELAFEMNINGDLEQRVEHYQCFSREYFCKILELYLDKKKEAVLISNSIPAKEEVSLMPPDYTAGLMQALINDRKNASEGREPTTNHTIDSRLELLSELFDVKITEGKISGYRTHAVQKILAELNSKKWEARSLNKLGREVELVNQIVRLKEGRMITEKDEVLIQFEVNKLIYCNALLEWNEGEFIEHVESQMVK